MPIERIDFLLTSALPLAISTTSIGNHLRACGATPYLHTRYPSHEPGARLIANVAYAANVSFNTPWPISVQRRHKLVGNSGYNDRRATGETVLRLATHLWTRMNIAAKYGRKNDKDSSRAMLFVTDSPRLLASIVFAVSQGQVQTDPQELRTLDLIQVYITETGPGSRLVCHHFQPTTH